MEERISAEKLSNYMELEKPQKGYELEEAINNLFLAGRMIGYVEAVFAAAPNNLSMRNLIDLWHKQGWSWGDLRFAVNTAKNNGIEDIDSDLMKSYAHLLYISEKKTDDWKNI